MRAAVTQAFGVPAGIAEADQGFDGVVGDVGGWSRPALGGGVEAFVDEVGFLDHLAPEFGDDLVGLARADAGQCGEGTAIFGFDPLGNGRDGRRECALRLRHAHVADTDQLAEEVALDRSEEADQHGYGRTLGNVVVGVEREIVGSLVFKRQPTGGGQADLVDDAVDVDFDALGLVVPSDGFAFDARDHEAVSSIWGTER